MPIIRFERLRKKWPEKDVLLLRFHAPHRTCATLCVILSLRKSSHELRAKQSHAKANVLGKVLGNLTMLFYEAIVFIILKF
jgi:hypothetical protein